MAKRYGVIYKITNKINNKIYIGQTIKSVHYRWKQHCRYKKAMISSAIRKYGEENFEIVELLSAFDHEELNRSEQYFIKYFNTISPNGYNLMSGGRSSVPSEEVKEKISNTLKGRTFSAERRANISLSKKGKQSPKKGLKLSKEQREKISKTLTGKLSPNWGRKVSSSQ